MVTARIRTNARRITVRVRNAPARTIAARPASRPVVPAAGRVAAPVAVRQKPTLKEKFLRSFRAGPRRQP